MDASAADRHHAILGRYLPQEAVEWVYLYLNLHSVHLRIARERRTKLGDYRAPYAGHPQHEISVGGNLPKHLFLWVFLHEAAHLNTRLFAPDAAPHGHEWQAEYARLLADHLEWFPSDLQPLIARYARRVPLNHTLGRKIEAALRNLDPHRVPSPTLDQQQPGIRFRLKSQPDRLFEALHKRRTRWLCRCLDDGREYLVAGAAEIIPEC